MVCMTFSKFECLHWHRINHSRPSDFKSCLPEKGLCSTIFFFSTRAVLAEIISSDIKFVNIILIIFQAYEVHQPELDSGKRHPHPKRRLKIIVRNNECNN